MSSTMNGTKIVPTISPKIRFLPGKSIRASAYAAIEAVTRISTALRAAAARLLRNHRTSGVCDAVEASGWWGWGGDGFGIQLSGWLVAALAVLNEVLIIHSS